MIGIMNNLYLRRILFHYRVMFYFVLSGWMAITVLQCFIYISIIMARRSNISIRWQRYPFYIRSKIVIVLVHWNNNPQIDISLHSNTLSWLRASLSECVAEKHKYHFYNLWFHPIGVRTHFLPHCRWVL